MTDEPRIYFNRAFTTGRELDYIAEAVAAAKLSGNGPFSHRCNEWLEVAVGARRSLLTHSCTGALEIAALLAEVAEGDEVVMPSFTFVSTANAVVLRGGVPVFVDIREDTLNLDESALEAAITPRTRAILAMHYAGVGCEMDSILEVAEAHDLLVLEDAAQALLAEYRGRALGSFGAAAALSFHETKNVVCGEGGALLVNREDWVERAEILHEKGTDRSRFFRGLVDKYSWIDIGSSFPLSELAAAFLWAQLEHAREITRARLEIWDAYHAAFEPLEERELVRRPVVPDHCTHNAHLYYLLLPDGASRDRLIARLDRRGIDAVFHYVPLHSSTAGRRFGRAVGALPVTDATSERLVRLPLWAGMDEPDVSRVVDAVNEAVPAVAVARAS